MSKKRDDIEAHAKIGAAVNDSLCIIHEERARRREAGLPSYASSCNEMPFEGDDLDDEQEIYILARAAKSSPLEFARRVGELMEELAWYYDQNGWKD